MRVVIAWIVIVIVIVVVVVIIVVVAVIAASTGIADVWVIILCLRA